MCGHRANEFHTVCVGRWWLLGRLLDDSDGDSDLFPEKDEDEDYHHHKHRPYNTCIDEITPPSINY